MSDESRSLFFMRTFGFALFWIWLFLVAVSPSPLFGALKGLGSLPFEVWEVGARLLLLSLSLAATRLLTTSRGRWVYPVCCLVGGPVAALALSSAATPEAVTLAAFITAVVDVAMLIMWLCYFGYAKIGDIAFMLACSYALGSILYLAVVAAGETAMLVAAITSPILSGALFAYFVKNPPSLASEGLFQASPAADRRPKLPAALRRLAIGLTLYAFVFALFSSRTAVSEYTFSSGPLVQALASIVLAVVVIAAIRLSDVSIGLYALYRSVPLVFGGAPPSSSYCPPDSPCARASSSCSAIFSSRRFPSTISAMPPKPTTARSCARCSSCASPAPSAFSSAGCWALLSAPRWIPINRAV